jgi:hypothetical protein
MRADYRPPPPPPPPDDAYRFYGFEPDLRPPEKRRQFTPDYLAASTCKLCWRAYLWAWWHWLVHRHHPDWKIEGES